MRRDIKLFPDAYQLNIIFPIFFYFSPIIFVIFEGLWLPFRLHVTGKIDFDIIESVTYHPARVRFSGETPPYYSILTMKYSRVDFHLGQDFIRQTKIGDTIRVFVSDVINSGYGLPDNYIGRNPTLVEVLKNYKFQVLTDIGIVLVLLATLCQITYYVIVLIIEDIKKKHEKEKKLFVTMAIATSLINIAVYLILAIVFEFYIIKSAFYVETQATWLPGMVILFGSYIGVISPLLIYKFRKYIRLNHE